MKKYILTKRDDFSWEIGVERVITTEGDVFHFYDSPEIAVLMNPIHRDARLWECECDEVAHDGIRGSAKRIRLTKALELPVFTLNQGVFFAITLVEEAHTGPEWQKWAQGWLNGSDRSKAAAETAAAAEAGAMVAMVAMVAAMVATAAAETAGMAAMVAAAAAMVATAAAMVARTARTAARDGSNGLDTFRQRLVKVARDAQSW